MLLGVDSLCGKTDKGLAVSLDGAANGLVLSPAGDSMGKAHGWVVGEFLVGLEVGTGELECGNFGMTGGDATGATGGFLLEPFLGGTMLGIGGGRATDGNGGLSESGPGGAVGTETIGNGDGGGDDDGDNKSNPEEEAATKTDESKQNLRKDIKISIP